MQQLYGCNKSVINFFQSCLKSVWFSHFRNNKILKLCGKRYSLAISCCKVFFPTIPVHSELKMQHQKFYFYFCGIKWPFILSIHITLFVHWYNQLHFYTHFYFINITHIHYVHNIAGSLVPYNHACPKRGLIHRDKKNSVIRPLLYLQATMAG